MSYETDFDSAFTTLLGKAVGAITPTLVTTTPSSGGGSTTTATPITAGIEFVIDGGGSAITTGSAGGLILPFPISLQKVELQEFEGTTGSIVLDILAGVPGTAPTFASICATTKPTIVTGRHYSDDVLAGWTTTIERGVGLKFSVSSVTSFTRITTILYVRRTDV